MNDLLRSQERRIEELDKLVDAQGKHIAKLQRVVKALQSLLSEEDLDVDELASFNAYFIMKDALKDLEGNAS